MERCAGKTSSVTNKPDRKKIEKDRRKQMKNLCSKMVSVIPDHHFSPPKECLSQLDQIEQATHYIKILIERIEELRREKELALANKNRVSKGGLQSSMVKVQDLGSNLEIVLISGIRKKHFILSKVISIVEEEGAEVVTVGLSNIGDKILHTLHAKVKVSRLGVDTARIHERLENFIGLI